MEEYKKALITQINHLKQQAIENIENENIVPAMWDISSLIDLKAQLGILSKMEDIKENKIIR